MSRKSSSACSNFNPHRALHASVTATRAQRHLLHLGSPCFNHPICLLHLRFTSSTLFPSEEPTSLAASQIHMLQSSSFLKTPLIKRARLSAPCLFSHHALRREARLAPRCSPPSPSAGYQLCRCQMIRWRPISIRYCIRRTDLFAMDATSDSSQPSRLLCEPRGRGLVRPWRTF